ncbi:PEX3 [Sanghuangporus vaninii]
MFDRIRNYFHERRRILYTAAGAAGGFYLAGQYVSERLHEMRDQSIQMQKARENLRRRFQQNQEDVVFTVMTHLRTLEKAVIEGMDVETVTQELQSRSRLSRTATANARAHSPNPPPSESSLSSSVEFGNPSSIIAPSPSGQARGNDVESPTSTDASAAAGSSALSGSGMDESIISGVSGSASTQTQSWVQDFGSTNQGPPLSIPAPSSQRESSSIASPLSNMTTGMSDSITSNSLASMSGTSASASERGHPRAERSESSEREGSVLRSKTKVELWHEIKILTFTRTLTIIYSTTLLSLLTTIQLNIIGRSKYLQSIVQLHREEKLRERRAYQASISSLFFGGFPESEEDLERWLEEDVQDVRIVAPDSEMKFLTLSWWLLYVGWKDVGERVRRSVEEVFENVSLKGRLGPLEVHRLIQDVRRRVEHEVTYEGSERRINFLSTIVPPTPETLALVFGEGGVPGYRSSSSTALPCLSSPFIPPSSQASARGYPRNPESDAGFAQLLSELRSTASSPAFANLLEVALDRATDVLLDGLRKNVFHTMDNAETDVEIEKPRLANLLPGLARWSHLALNTVPNELVDSIMDLKEMTAFSAIIYSNFDKQLHPLRAGFLKVAMESAPQVRTAYRT